MKAMITGVDSLSNRIIDDLDRGLRVSEVPERYPVSLDQAKRLSRFRTILHLCDGNLSEEHFKRLKSLGMKSLPLSNLAKHADWAGLAEILSDVTNETTRDDVELLVMGLSEKKVLIRNFKGDSDAHLTQLEELDRGLHKKERKLLQFQTEINEITGTLRNFPQRVSSFVSNHLGFDEGNILFVKRINPHIHRELMKLNVILYDDDSNGYVVKDLPAFESKISNKFNQGVCCEWNPDKDEEYRFPSVICKSMAESIVFNTQELRSIKDKRLTIEQEIRSLKNKMNQSYLRIAGVPNALSNEELKQRKKLKKMALKWLFQKGLIVVDDFLLPNKSKADIFAFNEEQMVIINVKVSQFEINMDQKWSEQLQYCHEYYFLTPYELKDPVEGQLQKENCGQLLVDENKIMLIQPDKRPLNIIDRDGDLKYSAGRLLSQRVIYGY